MTRRGLERDRRYMLVDPEGQFITQREAHRLARVDVALEEHAFRLTAPAMPELRLTETRAEGESIAVRVWDSECEALIDPDGSSWFSRYLERPCRLVYMPEDVERAVDPKRAQPGDIVGFQDAYPFLLISEASLADLETRVESPLDMRRFRPNIVVTECEPFAEDALSRFSIGEVRFENLKPCPRCVVTTIDPLTAEAAKEPLATLATYRKTDQGVLFGVNLVHRSEGVLRVGDRVVLD